MGLGTTGEEWRKLIVRFFFEEYQPLLSDQLPCLCLPLRAFVGRYLRPVQALLKGLLLPARLRLHMDSLSDVLFTPSASQPYSVLDSLKSLHRRLLSTCPLPPNLYSLYSLDGEEKDEETEGWKEKGHHGDDTKLLALLVNDLVVLGGAFCLWVEQELPNEPPRGGEKALLRWSLRPLSPQLLVSVFLDLADALVPVDDRSGKTCLMCAACMPSSRLPQPLSPHPPDWATSLGPSSCSHCRGLLNGLSGTHRQRLLGFNLLHRTESNLSSIQIPTISTFHTNASTSNASTSLSIAVDETNQTHLPGFLWHPHEPKCGSYKGWTLCLHKTQLLNHLHRNHYLKLTASQRMVLFSLCGFESSLRWGILQGPLFIATFHSRQLVMWQLACSNAHEQRFLNTCSSAAANVALTHHAPVIAALHHVTASVVSKIEQRLHFVACTMPAYSSYWPSCCVPTTSQYVHAQLHRATLQLQSQSVQLQQLLSEEQETPEGLSSHDGLDGELFLRRFQLTSQWNDLNQALSIVYQPHKPSVLTRKLLRGDWHNSARLITPVCGLFSLLVPGQPSLKARYCGGTDPLYPELAKLLLFEFHVNRGDPVWRRFPADMRAAGTYDHPSVQSLLLALWRHAAERGGVLFSFVETALTIQVGHLAFMIATRDPNGQNFFLIADPEVSFFKLFSFRNLYDLVIQESAQFDLSDA